MDFKTHDVGTNDRIVVGSFGPRHNQSLVNLPTKGYYELEIECLHSYYFKGIDNVWMNEVALPSMKRGQRIKVDISTPYPAVLFSAGTDSPESYGVFKIRSFSVKSLV